MPEVEVDSAVEKKYVYVDTTEIQTTPIFDSAVTVQAPVEEVVPEEEEEDTIEVDTTVYRWDLVVAADSVKEWKELKSFAYIKRMDSLLKAEKEKRVKEKVKETSPSSSGGSWLAGLLSSRGMELFLWVLAGAFVLFVIYKLFVTEGSFMRKTKNPSVKTFKVEEEVITPESDLDRMIRESVQQRNYRLAVRYHYLQTLHALAAKKYVQLAADKTNNDYIREIADFNRQQDFARLTLNYDYVWYGEFEIDELIYQKLKTAFQSFNSTV